MGQQSQGAIEKIVEQTARQHWGRIYASLVKYLNDFDLAEEALQEALVSALEHWPGTGIPNAPDAWLQQVARRKAIDRIRRRNTLDKKQAELKILGELEQQEEQVVEEHAIADERLRLIFTCCHPALAQSTRVALTLRTIGGLTSSEIARAFLLPETTLAQRLVRAKRKIKAANIPYKVPDLEHWEERLGSVLAVIYLIFNEGYSATSGTTLVREELTTEAIRLGRMLVELIPSEPEVDGLLALMLLHNARSNTRVDSSGAFVSLEQQNRQQWSRDKIELGLHYLNRALSAARPGAYQIQAAISAIHAEATTYADTDWHQITLLYERLYQLQPSPVIKLNAIVAASFYRGAEAGLTALQELLEQKELASYQPLHAAHADMLKRAGRIKEAIEAYNNAIKYSGNAVERHFLEQRQREFQIE